MAVLMYDAILWKYKCWTTWMFDVSTVASFNEPGSQIHKCVKHKWGQAITSRRPFIHFSDIYRVTHHVRQNLSLTLMWKLRFSVRTFILKRNLQINVNNRFWRTWWVTLYSLSLRMKDVEGAKADATKGMRRLERRAGHTYVRSITCLSRLVYNERHHSTSGHGEGCCQVSRDGAELGKTLTLSGDKKTALRNLLSSIKGRFHRSF